VSFLEVGSRPQPSQTTYWTTRSW